MLFPGSKIDLDPREDRYSNTFHVGRNQSPFTLKFKKGVVFFVFLSEEGSEELHIGCARPGSQCDTIKRRLATNGDVDRYVIKLERHTDESNKTYFMGIVQDDNIELSMDDGFVFFVFSSKEGEEELHITKNKEVSLREDRNKTEIINKRPAESGQYLAMGRAKNIASR